MIKSQTAIPRAVLINNSLRKVRNEKRKQLGLDTPSSLYIKAKGIAIGNPRQKI
jgi:hypothetical protein